MRWLRRLLSPPAGASPRRLCHRHRLSDRSSGWLLRLVAPCLTSPICPGLANPQGSLGPWPHRGAHPQARPLPAADGAGGTGSRQVARQQWLGPASASACPRIWWRLLLPPSGPPCDCPLRGGRLWSGGGGSALLLGPDAPPPLAVRLWLWYQDADPAWRGASASGALFCCSPSTCCCLAPLRLLERDPPHPRQGTLAGWATRPRLALASHSLPASAWGCS